MVESVFDTSANRRAKLSAPFAAFPKRYDSGMMSDQDTSASSDQIKPKSQDKKETAQTIRRAELLALFRILMKEPPPDHDFRTCPICKEFGITSI